MDAVNRLINEKVDFYDLKDFLYELSNIFKWTHYEKDTIGNGASIEYYANILSRWMNGNGLTQILDNALKCCFRFSLFFSVLMCHLRNSSINLLQCVFSVYQTENKCRCLYDGDNCCPDPNISRN